MPQNRWSMLAALFVVRTAMGFQFQTVGSVGPMVIDALGIDYARLGTLIGLYLLPGVIFALPGGMLGDRFGAKRVLLAGLVLMAVGGVLMGAATAFVPMVLGRLLSGAGAVLMNVMVAKMVADWFAGRETGTAMAVLVASWPLGLALGLLVFAPLATVFGWQAVMYGAAAVCVLKLLLVAGMYRDPPVAGADVAPADSKLDRRLGARESLLVAIAGFVWGVYNVGYIVLVSFLPSLFATKGYSLAAATGAVSLLGWALIGSIPIGGFLADRSRRPDAVMLGGFLITAVAAALLPLLDMPGVAFAVLLVAAGLPAGSIMALPASALTAPQRASGMGMYFTCYYGFMAVFPALAGLARDLTGSDAAPVLFAAGMFVAAAFGVVVFRLAFRPPAQ